MRTQFLSCALFLGLTLAEIADARSFSVLPSFLRPGNNVIAVKVHNGECWFSYFNLLVTQVRTQLTISSKP